MTNMRYGIKEVANVIFFNTQTGKPEIFFDTLKVSSIENEAETAEARGGQGNNKLMAWDFGRTANLTMQDALLSDASLAMLAGNSVQTADVKVVEREQLTAVAGKVTLANTPVGGVSKVFVYEVNEFGQMGAEITGSTLAGAVVTLPVSANQTGSFIVFYEYTSASGAKQVSFTGKAFPATYRVVGDTFVRGEDGKNYRMQFEIAKAKLSPTFSLTMDVENVSTFDFNLEVLVDTSNKDFKLYDIKRLAVGQ